MIVLMCTALVLALGVLVWLAASALGVVLAVALGVALLAAVVVFVFVRLARSRSESRRWSHEVVTTQDGRQVFSDARRTEFLKAVETALEEAGEWDKAHSPADAKLIVARRGGRIEREVSR